MDFEFARFGQGWLFRRKDSTDDWEPCDEADVPTEDRMESSARAIGTSGHAASANGEVSVRIKRS